MGDPRNVLLFGLFLPLVGLLVLYHQLLWGATEQDVLSEISQRFKGKVVYANDLDVF